MYVFYIIYSIIIFLYSFSLLLYIPYNIVLTFNFFLNTWLGNMVLIYIIFNLFGYTLYYIYLIKKKYFFFKKSYFIIKTLWIGLSSFHPPLFYLMLIYIFSFNCKYIYKYIFYKKYIFINIAFIGFFFGSFWSLNNSVWSYYWVNDIIEIIYILFLFLILIKFHYSPNSLSLKYIIYFYFCILLILLSSRLKIINTRHNFINLYNIEVRAYFIALNFSIICLLLFKSLNFFYKKYININNYYFIFFNYIIYFFIIYIILINFFYKLLYKNNNYILYFHLILIIFFYLWCLKYHKVYKFFFIYKYTYFITTYKIYTNNWYFYYYIFFYKKVHNNIINFFLYNSKLNIYLYRYIQNIYFTQYKIYIINSFISIFFLIIYFIINNIIKR